MEGYKISIVWTLPCFYLETEMEMVLEEEEGGASNQVKTCKNRILHLINAPMIKQKSKISFLGWSMISLCSLVLLPVYKAKIYRLKKHEQYCQFVFDMRSQMLNHNELDGH